MLSKEARAAGRFQDLSKSSLAILRIFLLTSLSAFFASASAQAQTLAVYDMANVTNSSQLNASFVATGFTASPLSIVGASTGGTFGNHFYVQGWNTTLNTSKYYEATIGHPLGSFRLTSMAFSMETTSGTAQWVLRSSKDGFNANLASGSFTALVTDASVNLAGLGIISSPITFRWYVSAPAGVRAGFANHECPAAGCNASDVGRDLSLNGFAVTATTTTISSISPEPSVFGQPYEVTASVAVNAPAAGTPTGTFEISDGTNSCTTGSIPASGEASCTIPGGMPPGAVTLTATYSGDANFVTSEGTTDHTINKAATTTTITADPTDPSVYGQPYEVTATVAVVAPAAGTPTGTIEISDGSNSCTTASIPASGIASCIIPGGTAPGGVTLTASYSGDTNFETSSGTTDHTINKGATTTTIISDAPDPTFSGQPYEVTASVAVNAPATGTPTGNFVISDGLNSCTTPNISGGSASCQISSLQPPGTFTLTATYSGDTNFATSFGTTDHTIDPIPTTTTIAADAPDPSQFGEPYTVDVGLSLAFLGGDSPSGMVDVTDGAGNSCQVPAPGGPCTLSGTPVGTATLTASYTGDANYLPSEDTESHEVIQGATTTTITSNANDPSRFGETYTVEVTVAPVAPAAGEPSGAVTVSDGAGHSCPITLASGSGSCTLTGTPVGTATLTASYPGDTNFLLSSGSDAHDVIKGDTTTTITADAPDPTVFGESYEVSVTVAPVAPASGVPTGEVTVSDGISSCTIAALSGTGTGTCNLAGGAPPGAATITASYAGDGSFNPSSDTEQHSIDQGGTTTTITADTPDPSVFGQPYTVSVTVAPSGAASGIPGGGVDIDDGQGHNCSAPLTNGSGSCDLNGSAVGGATITAKYAGDTNFAGSEDTEAHTVDQGATTTTITSDTPDPSVFGQPYTVGVSVAPTGGAVGTPGGSVNIDDGQGHTCTATLTNGSGSCDLNGTAVGAATLNANYNGDTNFTGSSDNEPHTVHKGATTTTITDDAPDPSVFGQPYTVSVTVAPSGDATGIPGGSVDIDDGQGHTCTATLTNGSGSCDLNGTAVGAATLTANYTGDTSFTGSSDDEGHTVDKGATTTTITADTPDPSIYGEPFTVEVSVVPTGVAAGAPSGTVLISDGTNSCMTAGLSGGTAFCVLNNTPVGNATLTATYPGDASFSGSTDDEPHTVDQIPTSVSIISSVNPSLEGQPITFTATVSPATVTGTVTFRDGATVLGTGTISGGVATITVSTLAAGPHSISATYDGDPNHATAASTVLPHTVTPNGTVVLAVSTSEGDGTFNFSSPSTLLNTSVATSGGTGQTGAISLNPGTYTVTVALPNGFGLTAITCSDADSAANVSGKTATIQLASAELVTCMFTSANSRKKTVEVISRFMSRRADLLLSNEPDGNRQIDRLIEAGGGNRSGSGAGTGDQASFLSSSAYGSGATTGPSRLGDNSPALGGSALTSRSNTSTAMSSRTRTFEERLAEISSSSSDEPLDAAPGLSPFSVTGSSEGTTRLSFATSLSQIAKFNDDRTARKSQLDSEAMGLGAVTLPSHKRHFMPFDIWMEGHYFSFADDRDNTDSDGHFGVVYLGADYVVNPSFLIGALIQYDSMKQASTRDDYRIEGHGWMAGPYATLRLSENVFLQARAAWGKSDNDVSPFLTYTDNFDSTRWLVSSTLKGRWQSGPWQLRPSATIAFIEDRSEAYVDSLGVTIPGVKVSLGQFKAGPEVSYRYESADGTVLEPHASLEAVWNFSSSDQVADFGGTLSGPEELRGRVELGITAKFPSGVALDLSGSYDGIGSDEFQAIGGKAIVRIPLN